MMGRELHIGEPDHAQAGFIESDFSDINAAFRIDFFLQYGDFKSIPSQLLKDTAEALPRLGRGLKHHAAGADYQMSCNYISSGYSILHRQNVQGIEPLHGSRINELTSPCHRKTLTASAESEFQAQQVDRGHKAKSHRRDGV